MKIGLQKLEAILHGANIAFDIVDELGRQYPEKLAMLHIDKNKVERRFTFKDIKKN